MEPTVVTDTREPQVARRTWGLLVVVCGAIFLEGIDIAMLNVAVPAIAADIGLATGAAHWVISAYVLGYAGFMMLGGRVADLYGRRRVFLLSLGFFVAFSGLGGLAEDSAVLIVARFVTGVTAGFMTPAGFSIVTSSFPEGPPRDRALAIYGGLGAGGFVLGMVAGGLLTTASWRWVFFAPMVLGAVILVAGSILIRRDVRRPRDRRGFDLAGAVTVTGGMIAIIYALVSLGEDQDVSTGVVALLVGIALLAAFLTIERRAAEPLVRLGLLRQGLLPYSTVAGLLFMAGFFGFQFPITLYLQDLRGWSPLETGLTFAIMGADMILAPLLAPILVRRFGNLRVMTAGMTSAAAAFALALRLQSDWVYVDLLPSLVLVAVAFALVYGPLVAAATEGLGEAEHGAAGGVVYTGFQFGAALGLAAVTIALVGGHDAGATTSDYQRALIVPTSFAVAAVAVGLVAIARRRRAATS